MNNLAATTSKQSSFCEDDEIFDDSLFLANFEDTSFKQTKNTGNNLNDSRNNSALNVSALCCDEEMSGYDRLAGETWIYPTNYPVRDYQFNIINAALVKNTLVSLPTGLGKTFIAAVIMYNFYRWYPLGKIVFTAPTRPLVAQQIEACYNIIAIPPEDTIEMTGHMQVNTRKAHWQKKRVFFATPQVIYNDIKSGICPADKIRCLVIDEAHRARGNYAYCQIVATLDDLGHKTYRMLALSATPGSKVEDVISVVKSLHIAHLELRDESCIDVAPYSHSRKINTVLVQLGPELTLLRQQYIEILDGYARRLKQFNILPQNLGNLSKGRIVMLYKEYQNKDRASRHPQHNYIMKDFTFLIALYHGLELLMKHGSRVFLNFFDEHPEKSWIQADERLVALLERLRDDLGVNPLSLDRSILPDGTVPEIPKNLTFGHPKFDKLKEIMVDHFTTATRNKQDTRAIVFCEYRESVSLVHCLLLQCRPLIKPQTFVGQGASGKDGKTVISQKQQLRVMRCFRDGLCNALIATCVAEEGLDVGSVDLIVCFDISTRSPVRLVQRCGRTGRERGGQVHILVTEGKEHQTLIDCMRQRDGLNRKILQSKEVENNLYKTNPRMMPRDFTPQCKKMYITVAKKTDGKSNEKISKKGQKDLRSMLLSKTSSSTSSSSKSNRQELDDLLITEEDFNNIYPNGYKETSYFRKPVEYWKMSRETYLSQVHKPADQHLNLSTWLEWQRSLHNTVNVGHSKDTEMLVDILQKCDEKRIENTPIVLSPILNPEPPIPTKPLQQSPIKNKTKKKIQKATPKSPAKKFGDIRALFSTATKSTKSYTKSINDLGIQNDGTLPTNLINLIVDLKLNLDNKDNNKPCYICENFTNCQKFAPKKEPSPIRFLQEPIFHDLDLIDKIDKESLIRFGQEMLNKSNEEKTNTNFDLEFDLDNLDVICSLEPQLDDKEVEKDTNFDIGDIDDIFADSSPEDAIAKDSNEDIRQEPKNNNDALGFFGLDSIEDIFADSDNSLDQKESISNEEIKSEEKSDLAPKESLKTDLTLEGGLLDDLDSTIILDDSPIKENSQEVALTNKNELKSKECHKNIANPVSPSILSGVLRRDPTSPILCSQAKKFQLSRKKASSTPCSSKKKLLPELENNNIIEIPDENEEKTLQSINNTTNKSMFTITQLVDMINKDNTVNNVSKCEDTSKNVSRDERSNSPILLSQAYKKDLNTSKNSTVRKSESIIILDSDSDSDFSEDANKNIKDSCLNITKDIDILDTKSSVVNNKRKLNDEIQVSPYFNKKQKLDTTDKHLTLQQKVLAALKLNKNKDNCRNTQTDMHCTVSQPNFLPLKEKSPNNLQDVLNKSDENVKPNPIDCLQKYRRDKTIESIRNKLNSLFKMSPKSSPNKENITFGESDDDFETTNKNNRNYSFSERISPVKRKIKFIESDDDFVSDESSRGKKCNKYKESKPKTNHKVRKKKKHNSLLDLEASLSDDGADSGDELSDESEGSIAEFICDDDATGLDGLRMYLESIKSPVKQNGFKIPELPKRFDKADVFSQFVEEDNYEMDSFCVDSHIGLTQVNKTSELELAEIILEEKRKAKRRPRHSSESSNENDSPVVKRNKRIRRIQSDSDDSS